jgi:hypothetical protein
MTDETPGPKAPGTAKKKKAPNGKPPDEGAKHDPKSTVARHNLVNAAQMPTYYTQAKGKGAGRHPIKVERAKALLQYLVSWDWLGNQHKTNAQVAYEMGMTLSTLNHVSKALVEAGMLVRKFQAMDESRLWIPQWDVIAASAKPWVPVPGKKPKEDPRAARLLDEDDQDGGDDESLARELHGMFGAFECEARLPLAAVQKLVKDLVKKHGFRRMQLTVRALERGQLLSVIKHAVEKPPAYLRVLLEKEIENIYAAENQGGGAGGQARPLSEADKRFREECAEVFARNYNNGQDGLPWEHLIPVFQALKIADDQLFQFYIDYAFEQHGPSYRGVPIEEAASQFLVRDLSYWVEQYDKEFPDGPADDDEDEDDGPPEDDDEEEEEE